MSSSVYCERLVSIGSSLMLALAVNATPADFSFIQVSDIHAPMAQSATTIARIKGLGEIELPPYGVTVAQPSFVLATGDLTEFGGGNGVWSKYLSYWDGIKIPVHHQLGNHDNTWHADINALRQIGRQSFYSFDAHGCHFIGLMTASLQDPRPSISEEQLRWVATDLEKTGRQTPVFVFYHHPLGGSEFASRYDSDRLLDILRGYNTVLLMAGHSHGFVHRKIGGLDEVTGGSTFGANAGFSVISVKDGVLRVAYWKAAQPAPAVKVLEKRIPTDAVGVTAEISSPAPREVSGNELRVYARLGAQPEGNVTYSIDGEPGGNLMISGTGAEARALGRPSISDLLPGAHNLRLDWTSVGKPVSKSTQFFFEPANGRTAWRAYLGASSKATPAFADGKVFVAANDGILSCFDAKSGELRWKTPAGAEVVAAPLAASGLVIAANGAGVVAARDYAGKAVWSFQAGDAVYSSPVLAGANVIFGCNNGVLYCVRHSDGSLVWTNGDAGYAIESQPCVSGSKVFYGAWDQYVRCVDAATGRLLWKATSEGVRKAKSAQRYYSPGDAAPVVVGGNVFVADRAYMLSVMNAETGALTNALEKVAAVGVSQDGQFAYLRRTDGRLTKLDRYGKEVWSVPAGLNAIPVAPTEHNGCVYVCSATGILSAFEAQTGKQLWQYSVSPRLFVMAAVACDSERAYTVAFDGSLTALKLQGQ